MSRIRADLGRNARRVRSRTPIVGGSWNPTRFDDVREMAKMTDVLSSRQVLVMPPLPGSAEMSRYEQMIAAPIADSRSIPGLVECCCRRSPKAVLQYERYTEELAHSLIDGSSNLAVATVPSSTPSRSCRG